MAGVSTQRPASALTVDAGRPRPTPAALLARLEVFEDGRMRDVEEVLAAAVEIEHAAEAVGDPVIELRARLLQADMLERKGETRQGVRTLWDIHAWAVTNDCRPLLARTHLLLARTHSNLGDMAACLDHSVSAVEYLDEHAPPSKRAFYLVKLADALGWTGSFDAARERYRQAEQLALAAHDDDRHLTVLNNLAYTEYEAGEPERAWAAVERMTAVMAATGQEPSPNRLDTMARIQIALGRHADAEQIILRAIALYEGMGYEEADALAEYLLTLAVAQRGLGATDRAQVTLDRSQALCAERALGEIRVRVLDEQAELYAATGDFRSAFETYKVSRAADAELRSKQREAEARTRQAIYETTEARREAERFREQARSDALTGLRNRRYVDEELPALIEQAVAAGAPLTVALVDLDHFKRINDLLSHDVGDRVLSIVADVLRNAVATISPAAFVARMGGEEFLVVLPGVAPAEAERHLDTLLRLVRGYPWPPVTGELPVTLSIGASATGECGAVTQSALLAEADRHLYEAKRGGRDRLVMNTRRMFRR
jgi:diguanylate cyclase (GGDEF)-like protein